MGAQKRGGGADIEDIDEVAFWSTKFGLGQQLIEVGNAGSRPCFERTRRDGMGADPLWAKLAGQVTHGGLEGCLDRPH
jgi:hypothetical protein